MTQQDRFAMANLTAGQLNALVKKLGGEEGALRLLRDELVVTEREPKPAKSEKPAKAAVLRFREDLEVTPGIGRFDPHAFFKTRKGLYLWNDMRRVLDGVAVAEPTDTASKLRSHDLVRNAYDREIKAELPETHEIELWEIARLIEAQKNGEHGPLLANGYANIFYVRGCAVDARWRAGSRGWDVYGWQLDGAYWGRGSRVFSRN